MPLKSRTGSAIPPSLRVSWPFGPSFSDSAGTSIRAQGVDPRACTDASIADDIEEIRSALAVPRVSLLGFSYGTRLALTFARRHPDRVDRLVLQGSVDEETTYESAPHFYPPLPPPDPAP